MGRGRPQRGHGGPHGSEELAVTRNEGRSAPWFRGRRDQPEWHGPAQPPVGPASAGCRGTRSRSSPRGEQGAPAARRTVGRFGYLPGSAVLEVGDEPLVGSGTWEVEVGDEQLSGSGTCEVQLCWRCEANSSARVMARRPVRSEVWRRQEKPSARMIAEGPAASMAGSRSCSKTATEVS